MCLSCITKPDWWSGHLGPHPSPLWISLKIISGPPYPFSQEFGLESSVVMAYMTKRVQSCTSVTPRRWGTCFARIRCPTIIIRNIHYYIISGFITHWSHPPHLSTSLIHAHSIYFVIMCAWGGTYLWPATVSCIPHVACEVCATHFYANIECYVRCMRASSLLHTMSCTLSPSGVSPVDWNPQIGWVFDPERLERGHVWFMVPGSGIARWDV